VPGTDTANVVSAAAPAGSVLTESQVAAALAQGLAGRFAGERVLVLVPDHTRSVPLDPDVDLMAVAGLRE